MPQVWVKPPCLIDLAEKKEPVKTQSTKVLFKFDCGFVRIWGSCKESERILQTGLGDYSGGKWD